MAKHRTRSLVKFLDILFGSFFDFAQKQPFMPHWYLFWYLGTLFAHDYNSYIQRFYNMGLSRKKNGVFLLTIVLCSSAALVYSAQSDAHESTKSLVDKSGSLYGSQSNLTIGSDGNLDAGGLFFKMMLMVLLVVVFGAAAIYLSKKLLPKLSRLPGKRIQVSETVHLGPRKAIHLIKIGTQTLLIGSTNENITKLADVTGQLSEVDLPANPTGNN